MIECKTLYDTLDEICEVLNNSITAINEDCVFECENIYEKARSKRFLTIRFHVVDDAWCITEVCTTGTSIFNDNDRPLEQFKTYQASSLFVPPRTVSWRKMTSSVGSSIFVPADGMP